MYDDCPVGTIVMWPGSADNLPAGWMLCDGTKYHVPIPGKPAPTDALYSVIGNSFNYPPGSSHYDPNYFLLPNLIGQFVRGVDVMAAVDPDAHARVNLYDPKTSAQGVGSAQLSDLASHSHSLNAYRSGESVHIQPLDPDNAGLGPVQTAPTGGKETRPVNIALYFIIKAIGK